MQVASAFSQMLNLHNLSEEISNAQIEKASRIGEVSCVPGPHVQYYSLIDTMKLRRSAHDVDRVVDKVHKPVVQKADPGAEGVARGHL